MSEQERYYFTPAGHAKFLRRIEEARAAYREVCQDNPAAREAGDSSVWHDNFAFEENQRLMHQLACRVRELEGVLERAEIVTLPERALSRVALGARVTYRIEGERAARTCVIVGHDEGQPRAGLVAYDSPLGRALLGARVGDEVELVLGGAARFAVVERVDLAVELAEAT